MKTSKITHFNQYISNRKMPKTTPCNLKQVSNTTLDSFQNAIIKKQPLYINREIGRLLKKFKI